MADQTAESGTAVEPVIACKVCRDSTTCSYCGGEGFDLNSSTGMQPCGLCGGLGTCTFCPQLSGEAP